MSERISKKYRNNICHFKVGDIVRFKDACFEGYYGEMRVVDFSIEVMHKMHKQRKKYIYNYLRLVPKGFCSECAGEDDIRTLDVMHFIYEADVYIVKE